MITLTRAVARAFRSLDRKCHSGRPRGPAPPVSLRQHDGRLTLAFHTDEVFLSWSGPAGPESESRVVPFALLDAIEGPGDDSIQIVRDVTDMVVARWVDRGVPRTFPVDSATPDPKLELLEEPSTWADMPSAFLVAMHDAGRTAARDPSRFALHRIQVRGKKGQVIGTDAKRAYLRSGFTFPFVEDILVSAVPVFGARELDTRGDVRVGRTDTHLFVTVGPWTVGLAIDTEGKFPDVAGALPRNLPTVVGIDDLDVAALRDVLPGLPGTDGEHDPVTLVADEGAFVRAGADNEAVEVYLTRSTFAGPACSLAMDRNDLRRMLALGCRTLRFAHDGKPVVGLGDQLTFAAMPLATGCAAPPSESATRLETDNGRVVPRTGQDLPSGQVSFPGPAETIPIPNLEERASMKPTLPVPKHELNGEVLDPLVEAEALRNALAEVMTRATRLVAALRHLKKEKRALSSVWQSLKDLNLGA